MLCERCRIREANIKYTEIINGVKNEHNLCSQCAKEMDFTGYSAIFDGEFPLGKLLSGLLGIDDEEDEQEDKMSQVICPTCGTSYEEFVNNSRFGCMDCYSVFDLLMSDNIKKLQGGDAHIGKQPKYQKIHPASQILGGEEEQPEAASVKEQIEMLKARLAGAISNEEYELAARYRDQIKELQKGESEHA